MARASDASNKLRGGYGEERANNDLLYYHLDVRVDPAKKTIAEHRPEIERLVAAVLEHESLDRDELRLLGSPPPA